MTLAHEQTTRRLAAIMSADVVGYSRLMGADEAGTLAALKRHRAELIDPEIARYGGRIVNTAGDSLLCEFPSVVAAVQCAADIQKAMPERNADLPEDRRMQIRIGVNLGDVLVEGDDIFGDGVNVAARLEALAEPGSVCISGVAYEAIEGKLDAAFEDMGPQTVKNIAKPVRAWRLSLVPTFVEQVDITAAGPAKASIAILPFTNMSGDPEQEYFADGITEDIITELSRFPELRVIARNSSFAFKGQSVDITEIGRKLGVAYVVEGSVRRAGNRVRVTAQLIDTSNNEHIWAQRYDRDLEDIFAVQDELVRAIAGTVPGYVERLSIGRARAKPPANMTAFDYMLRGRWAMHHTSDSLQNAVDLLEKAIEADPNYATAHAVLSYVYSYGPFSLGLNPVEAMARARKHADRALVLDPKDPVVNAAAASCYLLIGLHDQAETFSERGYRANPNDSLVLYARALVLAYIGQHEDGYAVFKAMESIEPYTADDTRAEGFVDCLYMMGRYEEAITVLDRWVGLPSHMLLVRAAAEGRLGRLDEARATVTAYEERAGPKSDPVAFVRQHMLLVKLPEDRERWLDGYRKAGLEV